MTPEQKIFSILVSAILFLIILGLIRRRKLREEYALLWFLISIIIFLLAAFEPLLNFIKHLLKAQAATSIVYMLGIFFLLLMNLHFSVTLSNLKNTLKDLAQKVALLDTKLQVK